MEWRDHGEARVLCAELPGATAVFTTRLGGVSAPPYESLNVATKTGDRNDAVHENRRRVAAAAGAEPQAVLAGRQVHAAQIQTHDQAPQPNPFWDDAAPVQEADGQATRHPGLVPLVMVADCLPVALAGPEGVAMLHCGWRGLAAGIVAAGAEQVQAQAAAVGPGIGPCCYEVGPEVAARFADLGDGVTQGRRLDLRAVTRRLLERAGVEGVEVSELCTSCHPELFFSHRRDGPTTGRQAGLVRVADGSG